MGKDIVQIIVYVVITGCATMLAKALLGYFGAKIDEYQQNIKIEKVNEYIDRAQELVENIVLSLMQTVVNKTKKEGKFDTAAAISVKNEAINMVKTMMNNEIRRTIVDVYGDLNKWIDTMIEQYVLVNKEMYGYEKEAERWQ